MRLSYLRVPTALVLAASLAGTITTPVFASERVVERTDNYTATCGPVTCSMYVTKDHIKRIRDTLKRFPNSIAYGTGSPIAACGAVSAMFPPAVVPCGAISLTTIGIGGYMVVLNDYVNKAADQNLCLKFRIPKSGGVPWFSTDTSRFCR